MNKNNRKILGYLFILIGIAVPLYGFHSISQKILLNQISYRQYIQNPQKKIYEAEKIKKYDADLTGKDVGIVDPFATDEFSIKYDISDNPDEIFAYLKIPVLDLIEPIRLGASNEHMAQGAAHVDGTNLPVGGIGKRSVIAGHRGYYQSIIFLHLNDLKQGDKVYIDVNGQTLTYQVTDKELINPSQWQKLNPIKNHDMLTLLTCDPILPPRPQRLLINCERVLEKPIETNQISENVKQSDKADITENAPYQKVKLFHWGIFVVTFLLWTSLIFVFYRLVLFLWGLKKAGNCRFLKK